MRRVLDFAPQVIVTVKGALAQACTPAGAPLHGESSHSPVGLPVAGAAARLSTGQSYLRVIRPVLGVLSRIRITIVYLGVLCLIDVVLDTVPGAARATVILGSSTNLTNLSHGRLGTLAASAFVYEGGFLTRGSVVLAILLATAEWSWGVRRLVWVFVAGHVGATLIVAAGLAAGIGMRLLPQSLAHSSDVGASYGMMAVGAALVVQLPLRLRPLWAACWLADGGAAWLSGRDFADAGHLVAFGIGLCIAAAWPTPDRSSVAALRAIRNSHRERAGLPADDWHF